MTITLGVPEHALNAPDQYYTEFRGTTKKKLVTKNGGAVEYLSLNLTREG